MTDDVTASFETLMEDAQLSAAYYIRKGVLVIDQEFGRGFAAKNPALLAAFMTTASHDMLSAYIKLASQDIRNGLTDAAESMADAIDNCLTGRAADDMVDEARGQDRRETLAEAMIDAARVIAEAIAAAKA